ncbi:hypothetical protein HanRHA438_Chr15g0695161 [Helianthus annuus]|nr:hypothetical protein HanIR_Chr15g0741951 [Helianthus annuus]KAJ0843783.1 hypothetical protein HanRHA438_Chr15g0695161 [Helianthus annuus]
MISISLIAVYLKYLFILSYLNEFIHLFCLRMFNLLMGSICSFVVLADVQSVAGFVR